MNTRQANVRWHSRDCGVLVSTPGVVDSESDEPLGDVDSEGDEPLGDVDSESDEPLGDVD